MKKRRECEPRKHLSSTNLIKMGIPRDYHHWQLTDLKGIDEVVERIEHYISHLHDNFDNNIGLFLFGSNGVGKSVIVSILLREAYRMRYTAKRTTMNLLTPIGIRAKYDEDINSDYYQYFMNVDFLAIEELGKEQEGEKRANITILEEVLRHRTERGLPTFLISNLPPAQFREKYGESIFSLVNEFQIPIKIVGVDNRQTLKSKDLMKKFWSDYEDER